MDKQNLLLLHDILLPSSEDIKKLEHRVKSEEKKIAKQVGKLPKGGEKDE